MKFRCNSFSFPGSQNSRHQFFQRLLGCGEDIVVMVVEHERNIQLFANWKKIIDVVAQFIVLQNQTSLDVLGYAFDVVLLEAFDCARFVSKDASSLQVRR